MKCPRCRCINEDTNITCANCNYDFRSPILKTKEDDEKFDNISTPKGRSTKEGLSETVG